MNASEARRNVDNKKNAELKAEADKQAAELKRVKNDIANAESNFQELIQYHNNLIDKESKKGGGYIIIEQGFGKYYIPHLDKFHLDSGMNRCMEKDHPYAKRICDYYRQNGYWIHQTWPEREWDNDTGYHMTGYHSLEIHWDDWNEYCKYKNYHISHD